MVLVAGTLDWTGAGDVGILPWPARLERRWRIAMGGGIRCLESGRDHRGTGAMNDQVQAIQSVPFLDLKRQFGDIREPVMAAISAVCESQQFVLGAEVEALEKEIADYTGTRFGTGMSSGTDALLVALMAFGVGQGDAVLTSPYSFFATAGVIARLGARPIFADIEGNRNRVGPR